MEMKTKGLEIPVTSRPKVVFIIPFASPNSGKSFVWKQIEECLKSD